MKDTLRKFIGKIANIRSGTGTMAKMLIVYPKVANHETHQAIEFALKSLCAHVQPNGSGWICR